MGAGCTSRAIRSSNARSTRKFCPKRLRARCARSPLENLVIRLLIPVAGDAGLFLWPGVPGLSHGGGVLEGGFQTSQIRSAGARQIECRTVLLGGTHEGKT